MRRPLHLNIRPERPEDADAVRAVHVAAFPTPAEAKLVDDLRRLRLLTVSLVAVTDESIVGHIAFSPVTVNDAVGAAEGGSPRGVGLAPVAVSPVYQRRGVGAALVRAGVEACAEAGCGFAVVLGEPAYYTRFGFEPASRWGLDSEYDAGDAFMALPLRTEGLSGVAGSVRYAPPFAALG